MRCIIMIINQQSIYEELLMSIQTIQFRVNIPSVDEYTVQYRRGWFSSFARGDGGFLFDLLMTPDSYIKGRIATLDFALPAVAGVAETCYRAHQEHPTIEWNQTKQFCGTVIRCLMEANGFEMTGTKKAV